MVESAATNPIAEVAATNQDIEKPVVVSTSAAAETPIVPVKDIDWKKQRIHECFTGGKRDYIAQQLESAADKLGEATSLSVEVYGEFAPECYDVHVYYGKTLLDIGRSEDDVLKTAMTDIPMPDEMNDDSVDEEQYGNPETLTEEEREEIKDNVDDALASTAADTAEKTVEESTDSNKPEPSIEENKSEDDLPLTGEEAEAEPVKVGEEGAADSEGENEDCDAEEGNDSQEEEGSTFQTAWEVLEVARHICMKMSDVDKKEWEVKKSEVLLLLGECAIEDENYKQAIVDLTEAYELIEKHVGVSRRLADTFYTLARAHKLYDDFDQAVVFFRKTKDTFEKLAAALREKAAETDEEKSQDTKALEQYESFLPDLDALIEDAIESGKQIEKQMEEKRKQVKEASEVFKNVLVTMTDAPAADISNLVRKKRPAQPETADEEKATKRAKSEEPCVEGSLDKPITN